MVHGGAGRGGASLPGRAQPATALSHPARLDKGAASQAALRVLELHGQAELDLGGGGSPEASHRPLTSSSTGARRPCSSPQRSFPSCPAAVPAPPRTGKVAPSHPEAAGRREGAGSRGRWGTRCWFSEEERRLRRPLSRSGPELLLQAARGGRGMGSEAAAAGGRRLEAGAGGGAGGRPRAAGWRGAAPRTADRTLPTTSLCPSTPTPFPPASVRGGPRGTAFGVIGTLTRMLAGEKGSVCAGSRDAAWAWARRGTCLLRTAGLGRSP